MNIVTVGLPILLAIIFIIIKVKLNIEIPVHFIVLGVFILIAINFIVIKIDIKARITDTEIWSGRITEVGHKEEWDEWIPPKTVTKTRTKTVNGKTKTETYIETIPGKWKHHSAKNWIKTSDGGKQYVTKAPDGTRFKDSYPNKASELYQWWEIGQPTSSLHKYDNYLKVSSSIYKYEEIDIKDYKHLPEYPNDVKNFMVMRLLGAFPEFDKTLENLNEMNSNLNTMITDEETGKKKSWKEINVIVVNVGNVPIQEAYALQEKWENGNKNDFIIVIGSKGTDIEWTHVFSWAEDEALKIEVRNMINNYGTTEMFYNILDETEAYIIDKFDRKEMADFEYIQLDPSGVAYTVILLLNIILSTCGFIYGKDKF